MHRYTVNVVLLTVIECNECSQVAAAVAAIYILRNLATVKPLMYDESSMDEFERSLHSPIFLIGTTIDTIII